MKAVVVRHPFGVSVRLLRACAAAVIKVTDSCMCERAGYYDEGER